ncbi:hypothetical protein AB0J81_41925 [Streptomyces bobili]|uniref:hypothetical protein n=1 Tax=Streptomyces bobili TaxID=67280 RepID=UPI00343FF9EB
MFARLHAAGITCTRQFDRASEYAEVPLGDDSMILFSGTTADGDDVHMTHPAGDHDSWQASWTSPTGADVTHLYDTHGKNLSHEADTAALVASIIGCVHEHGASNRTGREAA